MRIANPKEKATNNAHLKKRAGNKRNKDCFFPCPFSFDVHDLFFLICLSPYDMILLYREETTKVSMNFQIGRNFRSLCFHSTS